MKNEGFSALEIWAESPKNECFQGSHGVYIYIYIMCVCVLIFLAWDAHLLSVLQIEL